MLRDGRHRLERRRRAAVAILAQGKDLGEQIGHLRERMAHLHNPLAISPPYY